MITFEDIAYNAITNGDVFQQMKSSIVFICTILLGFLAVCILLNSVVKDTSKLTVVLKVFGVIAIFICFLSLSSNDGIKSKYTEGDSDLTKKIKDYYSIEVEEESLIEARKAIIRNNDAPSPAIYAKTLNEEDKRVYEVYLVKEGEDSYGIYTRNEKGVYLPLTKASEEELKKQ